MKLNITCSKCGSEDIKVVSKGDSPIPFYKCGKCGYEKRIFPGFESDKIKREDSESDEKIDEPEEEIMEEVDEWEN
jgi:DNA-directed RNA polymerase subunit M/transcription elongation factor TFIIS